MIHENLFPFIFLFFFFIYENPFPSPLPRHSQALTFFFQLVILSLSLSIQLSSNIVNNCPHVASKLQEELAFLVVFSMIGKLFANNFLLCSSQVVSASTFQLTRKEVVELPLVATRGDCQGQVTIPCFQSFVFIEIYIFFFNFKLFFS